MRRTLCVVCPEVVVKCWKSLFTFVHDAGDDDVELCSTILASRPERLVHTALKIWDMRADNASQDVLLEILSASGHYLSLLSILTRPVSMNPEALKPVSKTFCSHIVVFVASLIGKLEMMNSWKRYTTAISAETTTGLLAFVMASGHGYVFAGLSWSQLSPFISRYSGKPSSC